jgi:DNA-binding MarR family transcriptional regulator
MIKEEYLKLDYQVCFKLYVASKEIIRKYTPLLEKLDLTYTQYITMLALWEKDQISVKELGEKLYLDSGTLTPLLNKLKSKGLIDKTKQEKDGRELILSLTKKGIELKEKALNIPEAIASCVKLEKDEAIEFFGLLNKVLQGFYGE